MTERNERQAIEKNWVAFRRGDDLTEFELIEMPEPSETRYCVNLEIDFENNVSGMPAEIASDFNEFSEGPKGAPPAHAAFNIDLAIVAYLMFEAVIQGMTWDLTKQMISSFYGKLAQKTKNDEVRKHSTEMSLEFKSENAIRINGKPVIELFNRFKIRFKKREENP
jgi:hypothetical protein